MVEKQNSAQDKKNAKLSMYSEYSTVFKARCIIYHGFDFLPICTSMIFNRNGIIANMHQYDFQ